MCGCGCALNGPVALDLMPYIYRDDEEEEEEDNYLMFRLKLTELSHSFLFYCCACFCLYNRSIHLHIFQSLSRIFPELATANAGFCVGPHNKSGRVMQGPVLSAHGF